MSAPIWIKWTGAKAAHAASVHPGDVSSGHFPLACGRWAPDPMDRPVRVYVESYGKRCARCEAAS